MCYNEPMEGQEYLNQISASNRPVDKPRKNIFSSKFVLVGVIGLAVLIFIIIIGAFLGGNKTDEKSLLYSLKLHVDNTEAIVQEYQSIIKSSELRSYSASLQNVLHTTSADLSGYFTAKYNFKNDKDIDKKLVEEATLAKDSLNSELFEAKINGVLDRIFTHKMAYEISLIQSEESRILKGTKNTDLQEILNKSNESLTTLQENFDNYSETN